MTLVFRLTLLLVVIAITYLATTPEDIPVVGSINDKANHAVAFYVLALLLDFSFPHNKFGIGKILALLSYGGLIEAGQYFIPNRHSSAFDLFADVVGIVIYGFSIPILKRVLFFHPRWNRKNEK